MATYRNQHRKPLDVGRVVEPGGTFTDKDAVAAGVNVAALLRARVVKPVRKTKPAAKKAKTMKAGK